MINNTDNHITTQHHQSGVNEQFKLYSLALEITGLRYPLLTKNLYLDAILKDRDSKVANKFKKQWSKIYESFKQQLQGDYFRNLTLEEQLDIIEALLPKMNYFIEIYKRAQVGENDEFEQTVGEITNVESRVFSSHLEYLQYRVKTVSQIYYILKVDLKPMMKGYCLCGDSPITSNKRPMKTKRSNKRRFIN